MLLLLDPWQGCGRAVAVDSTPLRTLGGVWHRKHREAGVVPHTSIDTEAHWTKPDWHGWVYGWKLHLVNTVVSAWMPLAAELTAAKTADNGQALFLLEVLPAEARFILGDTAYDDAKLRQFCERQGRILVTSKGGPYLYTDEGWKYTVSFTGCALVPSRTSTASARPYSIAMSHVPTRELIATCRHALTGRGARLSTGAPAP